MRPTLREARAALAGLTGPRRRRAFDRYRKLRPHLEEAVPLTRVAAEAGLPLRTAQRWVSRYRRFGLAGLSRAARADRGKRRRVSDELCRLAEGLALQEPALGPGAIHREVSCVAQAQGQAPRGYHTIYNVIRGARSDRS
jgi:putative transposase